MEAISGENELETKISQSTGWCLVDFWGPSCPPCIVLSKSLTELEPSYPSIQFFTIIAGSEMDIASKFGVRGLTTLILFKNGLESQRWIGNISKSKLTGRIEAALKT